MLILKSTHDKQIAELIAEIVKLQTEHDKQIAELIAEIAKLQTENKRLAFKIQQYKKGE